MSIIQLIDVYRIAIDFYYDIAFYFCFVAIRTVSLLASLS